MTKQKKTSNKYIPTRNYIYAALMVLVVIFLIWYALSWYTVKKQDKLMNSYLITTNTLTYEIKDINEIPQVLRESPNEYFIYISYTNDEGIYKLEKKLKKVIDEYSLKDEFYYINVTDTIKEKGIYTKLNNAFNTTEIKHTPCILYFKNNELQQIIYKENGIFNINEFTKLLKDYEYVK